jgi:ribosomal protein L30E
MKDTNEDLGAIIDKKLQIGEMTVNEWEKEKRILS